MTIFVISFIFRQNSTKIFCIMIGEVYIMIIIENLILLSILLIFPFTIYLIYIAYVNNMDLKEKNLFLDFALLSSLFLMAKYIDNQSLYVILFYNIPLLIAYLRKKKVTAIIISFIIIYFYSNYSLVLLPISIIEYFIYYIAYLFIIKMKNKESYLINVFISIKSFLITFFIIFLINPRGELFVNVLYIVATISIFILFTYFSIGLFKKGEEIINLNNSIKDMQKQQFLYESLSKLTHELKNPITVCKGYLEIMNSKGYSSASKYLPIISNEIDRSLSVINDFSTLGKLTTLNKEEVDIEVLLEEVIATLRPLFKKEKAKIVFNTSGEIYIYADYNRLKQVFINILKNSLEAKKDNIPLEVVIKIKEYKRIIKVDITDNGIGMNKETLDNMHKIFYTTKANGNGLGVILSSEIIELHKGKIKYTSTENIGTTVSISLPIK